MTVQVQYLAQAFGLRLEQGLTIVSAKHVDPGTRVYANVVRQLDLELDGDLLRPVVTLSREGYETLVVKFNDGLKLDDLRRVGGTFQDYQANAAVRFLQENHENPEVFICVTYRGIHLEEMRFLGHVAAFMKTLPIQDPNRRRTGGHCSLAAA